MKTEANCRFPEMKKYSEKIEKSSARWHSRPSTNSVEA
jgi:hypothetical protein